MTPRLWAILLAGGASTVAGYVMIGIGVARYVGH